MTPRAAPRPYLAPTSLADRAGMGVADHAGVAMSSVSRVLLGHPDVSEAMRSSYYAQPPALAEAGSE